MSWKFWQRDKTDGGTPDAAGANLPKPKDMPQKIGMYLVVNEKADPDYVWSLKCAVRQRPERKTYFDFRIFDPNKADQARVKVLHYASLDNHPELILYKGRYDKDAQNPELDREPPLPRAA